MGPGRDGWLPSSIRSVPGRSGVVGSQRGRGVVAPAATSVEKDCTRLPCTGGVFAAPGLAIGHVTCWALVWSGGNVVVRCVRSPRPPPNWPTITSEVGIVYGVVLPVGVNERLFVRLICRICPVGTVITTGDHVDGTVATVDTDAGFNAAQVAPGPALATTVAQGETHLATRCPPGTGGA